MRKVLEQYCVGCGLCESFGKAVLNKTDKGFSYPIIGDEDWLMKICPCSGMQEKNMDFSNIWGRTESVYYGWSSDPDVRNMASSGGVLTEIASYLLETGLVDAVIHICADPNDPTKTICCQSSCRSEVLLRCGSRYSISHPLEDIAKIDRSKKYVFIGKPCDIVCLRNYMEMDHTLNDCIVYLLSFFCAGLPSTDAQDKLMEQIGCPREKCVSLRYRGDGWPGVTKVVDIDGNSYQMDYISSWGKILGRDIMKMCRFCIDGIGEAADISCGDAWYLTSDQKPIFTEAAGRNIIFARTSKGKKLLEDMIKIGKIEVAEASIEDLRHMQTYQWDRRATMLDKYMAMRLLNKSVPHYGIRNMYEYSKSVGLKKHIRIFTGLIKRILRGKI